MLWASRFTYPPLFQINRLRQADAIDLPVFELPREVPFVEISQSIYERLVSGSYARLQRSAGIHRELVRLVVDGADLGTVVRRAAAMLGNPVVVEDDAGRLLAGWRADGRPHRLGPGGLAQAPQAVVVPVVARGITHGRVGFIPERAAQADDVQALEQVATVVPPDPSHLTVTVLLPPKPPPATVTRVVPE